jgi:uncharacterized protein YunC (DUF1805 family)
MKNVDITINGQKANGLEVSLPGAPLVLAHAPNGFVMCGYLNIETANKLGVAAAMVRGVNTVSDLLEAKVVAVSEAAQAKGAAIGMTGRDALSRFA